MYIFYYFLNETRSILFFRAKRNLLISLSVSASVCINASMFRCASLLTAHLAILSALVMFIVPGESSGCEMMHDISSYWASRIRYALNKNYSLLGQIISYSLDADFFSICNISISHPFPFRMADWLTH